MEKQEIKWLEWDGDAKEWGKIECPMLNNEMIMTYYPKGVPCYYSYTAPFIDAYGDVCFYRYDHDEGCWDEDIFSIIDGDAYKEGMEFRM